MNGNINDCVVSMFVIGFIILIVRLTRPKPFIVEPGKLVKGGTAINAVIRKPENKYSIELANKHRVDVDIRYSHLLLPYNYMLPKQLTGIDSKRFYYIRKGFIDSFKVSFKHTGYGSILISRAYLSKVGLSMITCDNKLLSLYEGEYDLSAGMVIFNTYKEAKEYLERGKQ